MCMNRENSNTYFTCINYDKYRVRIDISGSALNTSADALKSLRLDDRNGQPI